MAIAMTRPTPHPKTGVYRVRVGIPPYLRDTTQRLYGVRTEFIRTLGTKSERAAVKAAPALIAEFEAMRRAAEADYRGEGVKLTDRDIGALCGQWLAQQEVATADDLPHGGEHYGWEQDIREDVLRGDRASSDLPAVHEAATGLLAVKGLATDPASYGRLITALIRVQRDHYADLVQRADTGRWRATFKSSDFPVVMSAEAARRASATGTATLDVMLDGWGRDRGWSRTDKPMSRNFYDRLRTMERLAKFLGHRVARQVGKEDVARWKAEMQDRKLSAATVRNDLSEMSAIWKWAMAHDLVELNPFAGLLPPKAKKKREVRPFTGEEARAILLAARAETGALRWLPWLLCHMGARLNEVCQAERQDVAIVDGVLAFRIHDVGEGRSVKNTDGTRVVPLHAALIAEGFPEYVAALPEGSTLWPELKLDAFGRRSGTGGRKVARWLAQTLKINDPLISPNHSWRHTFIDACRRVVMPGEVRSAITGHSGRMDESAGYGAGMKTMVQVMAEYMAKVPSPLDRSVTNAAAAP